MSLVTFVEALFVGAVLVAISFAVLWSLFDVAVRARETPISERVGWAFLLVAFNVLAAVFYVNLGPGRRRWTLWGDAALREDE